MLNITKEKRKIEVILLGWLVISFAVYLFYKSIIILEEYLTLPFPLTDTLIKGPLNFKIGFFNVAISHIFSILLFIAGVKMLYLKRWAFILLISVFILDFIKKFYVMVMLASRFNVLFAVEIALLLLAAYCLSNPAVRKSLK